MDSDAVRQRRIAPVREGRGERGVAVALVLVLLVGLSLLGTGVLVLAEREAVTARAAQALVGGRLVAEGAAEIAAVRLAEDTLPSMALWVPQEVLEGSSGGAQFGVDMRSLGSGWILVRGWGRAHPMAPRVESGLVLWALRPLDRVASARAVLEYGGVLRPSPDAVIDGSAVTASGDGASPDACAPHGEALDSVFPTGQLAPAVKGDSPTEQSLPRLGLLDPTALQERIVDRAGGTLSPSPGSDQTGCSDRVDNWGSPTDPTGPCGGRRVALYVPGDLVMDGGEGQGLLLVDGSLTMAEAAFFAGLVVVRDSLTLLPDARISGLVHVGGVVSLAAGAALEGRACAALLALENRPELYRPIRVPGGPWLRPF